MRPKAAGHESFCECDLGFYGKKYSLPIRVHLCSSVVKIDMPGLESECQTERSKVVARWAIITILAALAQ